MPWGKYEIISDIQKFDSKQEIFQHKSEKYGSEYTGVTDEENQKKRNAHFQITPIDISKLVDRIDDEKKCNYCSTFNSPTNQNCKFCGSDIIINNEEINI